MRKWRTIARLLRRPRRGLHQQIDALRGTHGRASTAAAPVLIGSGSTSAGSISAGITSVGIDTWLYDVGGAIGFFDYAPSRWVWPYGFVGLGGLTHRLKQTVAPPLTFIERGPAGANSTIVVSDARQFLLTTNALRTETVFAVNIGAGHRLSHPDAKGRARAAPLIWYAHV